MDNTGRLTPQESLDLIADSISKTRENLRLQSDFYILWGWLVVVSALAHYALLQYTEFGSPYLPWLIVMPIGVVVTILLARKINKEQAYETYLDTFLKYLWIVLGVSFFIVVFLSISLGVNPTILTLLLAGIGTLISGLAMQFRPLVVGGGLFFAFSILAVYVDPALSLLINAAAIALGYLVPAYMLKRT